MGGEEVRENQPIYAAHDAPIKLPPKGDEPPPKSRRWAREHSRRQAKEEKESWTIDVPTVDGYLRSPPHNVVGQLQEVLCEVRSHVYRDEEVAVIETDKVSVSVTALREGVISAVLAKVGEEVKENQPIYAAHVAPKKLPPKARRWAREHSRREAEEEKEHELEKERILEMWRQRLKKATRARQRQTRSLDRPTNIGRGVEFPVLAG